MMHCSLSLSVHHRESGILQPNRIHRLPQHPRDPDTGRVRLRAPPPLPYQSDQAPHSGRIEHTQSVLQQQQQHGPGVHGNQSLSDTGSPLPQRSSNTQNSRLQGDNAFVLGGPGAPGGEGADHALDLLPELTNPDELLSYLGPPTSPTTAATTCCHCLRTTDSLHAPHTVVTFQSRLRPPSVRCSPAPHSTQSTTGENGRTLSPPVMTMKNTTSILN
ncbi:hypothetical protein INR49_007283 [Caranx melampygus]|nr:hypothetical protein INR49_007283 [Caranx melampygus]